MIKRNSPEWIDFINRLSSIRSKSNREVLCVQCWQMLNCKQKKKHLEQFPTHQKFLLTSTKYASEVKICELAHGYNKLAQKKNGEEFMLSPFAPSNLPMHLSDSEYISKPQPKYTIPTVKKITILDNKKRFKESSYEDSDEYSESF